MKQAPPHGPRVRAAATRARVAFVLAAALAASCQLAPPVHELRDGPPSGPVGAGAPASLRREWDMNRAWQNRRFSDLKAVLGSPLLLMTIPGGGNPPGSVAVYGRDPASGCIDAFALLQGSDPVIRVYHCR